MRKTLHSNNNNSYNNNGPMFEELSDGEDDSYSHSNHHSSNNSSVRYEDPDDHYNTHRHSHNSSNRRTSNNHHYNTHTNSNRRRREDNPFDLMSNNTHSLFQNDPFFSNSFDMMSSMMKTNEQMFKRMNQEFESHFNSNHSLLHENANNNNNGYTSYSSITTSSRRNDGNNIQSITKTKQTIKDSKTGKEKISIIKQVNDKKSITEKTRDLKNPSKEQVFKKLENVSTDKDFDKEWKQYSKQLPKFKSSSFNSLSHHNNSNNNQSLLLNENRRALNYEKKK